MLPSLYKIALIHKMVTVVFLRSMNVIPTFAILVKMFSAMLSTFK